MPISPTVRPRDASFVDVPHVEGPEVASVRHMLSGTTPKAAVNKEVEEANEYSRSQMFAVRAGPSVPVHARVISRARARLARTPRQHQPRTTTTTHKPPPLVFQIVRIKTNLW